MFHSSLVALTHSFPFSSLESVAHLATKDSFHIWKQSPTVTSHRLLTIICLLRVFLNFPGQPSLHSALISILTKDGVIDTERYATEAIAFYASSLATNVGLSFALPSLAYFASYWLDTSGEVQQAARLLFSAYLDSAPHHSIVGLAEEWQDLCEVAIPYSIIIVLTVSCLIICFSSTITTE